MSIKSLKLNNAVKNEHNIGISIVIIVACASIISITVGYHWGHYQGVRKADEYNNLLTKNSLNEEESTVNLYQGSVTGIIGNKLQISAKVNENGKVSEKIITVSTNTNTLFRKIDISVPALDPDELVDGQPGTREQTIELNDIQIGDNIIAEANENIFGKVSFESSQITVLSTGQ
jgi:hypothetical protein